jgi:hypothetical protein
MPERHSHVVGGSTAARKIHCPGADLLIAQVPKQLNRDSFYSTEGVALHTLMEMLITGKTTMDTLPEVVETRSGPVMITAELIADAVEPAWAWWSQEFLPEVDDWMIEAEVDFPGIEGAFGTCDVLGRDDVLNITHVADWKFGAGKGVQAAYDGVPNEQLMFYACAARNTYPDLFPEGCTAVLTIIQPRARDHEPITSVEVTMDDLDAFEVQLVGAMSGVETNPGRWCDFQPCKAICPHHTGPLLDLTAVGSIPTLPGADYLGAILRILEAAPIAEALIKEARVQAQTMLADGHDVPGWKLVGKRGTRQWAVDEATIMKELKVKKGDLYETSLRSPASLEKVTRKKVPSALAPMVSSGATLAPAGDKRPAISAEKDLVSKLMIDLGVDQS